MQGFLSLGLGTDNGTRYVAIFFSEDTVAQSNGGLMLILHRRRRRS
jgi:hypothetical protein